MVTALLFCSMWPDGRLPDSTFPFERWLHTLRPRIQKAHMWVSLHECGIGPCRSMQHTDLMWLLIFHPLTIGEDLLAIFHLGQNSVVKIDLWTVIREDRPPTLSSCD